MVKRKKIKDGDVIQIFIPQIKKYALVYFKDYFKNEFDGIRDRVLWFVFYCFDFLSDEEFPSDINIEGLELYCNPLYVNGDYSICEGWKILRDKESISRDEHLTTDIRKSRIGDVNYEDNQEYFDNSKFMAQSMSDDKIFRDLTYSQIEHLEYTTNIPNGFLATRIYMEYCKNNKPYTKYRDLIDVPKMIVPFYFIKGFSHYPKEFRYRHIPHIRK